MEIVINKIGTNVELQNAKQANHSLDDNTFNTLFFTAYKLLPAAYNAFMSFDSIFKTSVVFGKALSAVITAEDNLKEKPQMTPDRTGKYSNYRVAIIDDFENKSFKRKYCSHGELVQKQITENLPGVQIIRKQSVVDEPTGITDIKKSLEDIINEIEQGKKYDAINMSFSILNPVKISDLKIKKDGKEIQITNENINQYKDKLKELYKEQFCAYNFQKKKVDMSLIASKELLNQKAHDDIKAADEIYELIKKIGEKGVKIFLANNNYCATEICYSDLFDIDTDYENSNNPNLITISANDCDDRTTPLSDIKERSTYKLKFLKNGIDITDDDIPDIYDKNGMLAHDNSPIQGNSFGTPVVLAKYLKEQYEKNHPEEKANEQKK